MLVDSFQHLNPSDICLIVMYFDSGAFSIPVCFFSSLKNSCCNRGKFLLLTFSEPFRTWLANCVKFLLPKRDASGSIVHVVP